MSDGTWNDRDGAELTVAERAAYVIAGLGLAAVAVKPRPNPLLNVAALAAGSYLAWRGYVGTCPIKAALHGATDTVHRIPDES